MFMYSDNWFKARPTPDWKTKAKMPERQLFSVLVMRVRVIICSLENPTNPFYNGQYNTGADLFIVQEGVWQQQIVIKTKRLLLPTELLLSGNADHDSSKYVNTFEAAFCALTTLQENKQ